MSTQTLDQAFPVTTGTHPRLPNPPPSFPCKREPIPG